jgi:hypothetical protein
MTVVGVNRQNPIMSSSMNTCFQVDFSARAAIRWGMWTIVKIPATTAPAGRLIQKPIQ